MSKKKKIHVGYAMMRLNKAGNWVPVNAPKKYEVIDDHQEVFSLWPEGDVGDYYKGREAGTLKVKKAYVTM